MKPILMIGMHGLGDNIYMRPFVRAECGRRDEVYLMTPWPELYEDLPVQFVRPARQYRTQTKNIDRQDETRWVRRIPRVREARGFWYGLKGATDNAIKEFERVFPLPGGKLDWDLPDFGPSPVRVRKPVAVIRPATVRKEWPNPARNPDPKYIAQAAKHLRKTGWHTVSIADIERQAEDYMGEPPEVDERYDRGELSIKPLLALIQNADLVVGPVGWIVPACIAAGTPLIVIGGGMGGHNAPEKITDPRMDLDAVRFILPQPYCRCKHMKHDCPRTIPDFAQKFEKAVGKVTRVRLAA